MLHHSEFEAVPIIMGTLRKDHLNLHFSTHLKIEDQELNSTLSYANPNLDNSRQCSNRDHYRYTRSLLCTYGTGTLLNIFLCQTSCCSTTPISHFFLLLYWWFFLNTETLPLMELHKVKFLHFSPSPPSFILSLSLNFIWMMLLLHF